METSEAQDRFRSSVFRSEDWISVWLGFLVILAVLILLPQVPRFSWATDGEFAAYLAKQRPGIERLAVDAEGKRERDLASASRALLASPSGDRKAAGEAARGLAAASAADPELKKRAEELAKSVVGKAGDLPSAVFSSQNVWKSLKLALGFLLISAAGIALMRGDLWRYCRGFFFVYALAWISQAIAGNFTINAWGVEYVIFALALGLLVSNTVGVPSWMAEAARTEYFIKCGLVLLGAGILFMEIMKAGALGVVQAVLVVAVVWYVCFWISRKLRVDEEFAVMLSSAVSICGVSAAIAACGAIQGDRKKLSYVTSLVLIVAVPMMVLMPWLVKLLGLSDPVAGAWLGGTLDTSGSVVAACGLIGEPALKAGVIVKFSQNVLIGAAAFILSVWWSYRGGPDTGEKPRAKVIWERFPKFVLGFLAASFVFSFFLSPSLVNETKESLAMLRTTWFSLGFVSIGLETRFSQLLGMGQGRPALAFLAAQAFNVLWTLLLAILLFEPTAMG